MVGLRDNLAVAEESATDKLALNLCGELAPYLVFGWAE